MSPWIRCLLALCCVWLVSPFLVAQSRVTIRVEVPPSTPLDAQIAVAGNNGDLGNWNPSVVVLSRTSPGIAERTFRWERGTVVEFKITRGTWTAEAIYTAGVVPGNTTLTVGADTVLTMRPVGWSDAMPGVASTATGAYRTHAGLRWPGLREARSVTVRLPASYASVPSKRYPVLYMHDGQNCFDKKSAPYGAEWRADEVVDSLAEQGSIGEVIIVAVNNTSERMLEYSDTPQGRAYVEFLVHSLKPMIDSLYRTMPDADHTAVMGSSMGGLISFLCAWWYPNVFGKAACLSAVFERMRTRAVAMVEGSPRRSRPLRLYIDCGGFGGEATLKPGIDLMAAALRDRGYVAGKDVQSHFEPTAEHHERAWAARLWRPLLFLFGNQN